MKAENLRSSKLSLVVPTDWQTDLWDFSRIAAINSLISVIQENHTFLTAEWFVFVLCETSTADDICSQLLSRVGSVKSKFIAPNGQPAIWQNDHKSSPVKVLCVPKSIMWGFGRFWTKKFTNFKTHFWTHDTCPECSEASMFWALSSRWCLKNKGVMGILVEGCNNKI